MTGAEFIRRVRKLGQRTGTSVRFVTRQGKGSHGRLYYGTRFTTVKDRKKELSPGLWHAMARQLGIDPKELRGTMMMRYAYPATIQQDEDGAWIVTFPDVPEAITGATTYEEALTEAADALTAALAGYVGEGREIPRPSDEAGRPVIPLPPLVAAKLALYTAMRESGVNNSQLARRLGVTETVVRRLVDPDHASRIEKVEQALSALGRALIVEDAA